MIALGRVLQRHGGGYAAHVRDEASRVFEAVREAIAVGETCGVHVQIGHLKLSGIDNWGGAAALLGEIEAARRRGVRVDCDQYPYTAGSNPLRNLLPVWVQDGGIDALLGRLADPVVRARLRAEIEARGLTNFGRIPSWEAVRVALSPHRPETAGLTLAELARRGGGDGLDAACEQIIGDRGATRIVVTSMDERDVQAILSAPDTLIGSDGLAVAPEGPTGLGKPHPRVYGTFPRVLGHYARDLGLLPLPVAVAKMTGGPARALGLRERGLLRPGSWADITVFDPATVAERATYDDPHRYPAGIPTVIVNGAVVVDGGEHTGALPGRVLRRAG
jgi:N-acyl-D-aspartate/D-glutamate deacylase